VIIKRSLLIQKNKQKLKALYLQKQNIEREIYALEKEIEKNSSHSFVLKDAIYINTSTLSKVVKDRLKEFATFDNPQIKILLSLRKPIYNTPKTIKGYKEDKKSSTLILPRGLMRDVIALFKEHNIYNGFEDKRFYQKELFPKVVFSLRDEQEKAIQHISKKDFCLCVAPPGFGKTLIGAKMIELRCANTLVIVHKNMLLDQWIERFITYFEMDKKDIGFLGKSKDTLNGKLDIATMQSLKNKPETIKNYSHVIVDECHHIPAVTFEKILQSFQGKYILGLSATPARKDGMEPLIFQQLGAIAYETKKTKTYNNKLKIVTTDFKSKVDVFADLITEIINNDDRNWLIIEQILQYKNRKILLLTDRIEHIQNLEMLLDGKGVQYISIHGSMKKQEQQNNMKKVQNTNLVLATTSFFGEGIDFQHLNTIILATPISYYGRLVQYLGRIGRGGDDCLAIDILDNQNAFTLSAYRKRKDGYKQLHYKKI
jgi:superfamily II DNA or RNA helicase